MQKLCKKSYTKTIQKKIIQKRYKINIIRNNDKNNNLKTKKKRYKNDAKPMQKQCKTKKNQKIKP